MGIPSFFPAIFHKMTILVFFINFFFLLFPCLEGEITLKWGLLLGEGNSSDGSKFFSLLNDFNLYEIYMRGNDESDRVASPKSTPIKLSLWRFIYIYIPIHQAFFRYYV